MNQKQHNLIRNHLDYLSVKKTGPVETDTQWICLETQRYRDYRETPRQKLCVLRASVFSLIPFTNLLAWPANKHLTSIF